MEEPHEEVMECVVQSRSQTSTGEQEDRKDPSNGTVTATPHGCSTPMSKVDPSEMSDLTKTFTRRPAIHKDISPIADNSITSENATSKSSVRANRQKTITMDSTGLHEARRLFADVRQSVISLDDLETKIVELMQTKDMENKARLAKVIDQNKHHEKRESTTNEANLMVYRALTSEYQMMLEELTSGAYIHVERLAEHGYTKGGSGCGDACKVATERDTIKAELDSLHEDYSKLYESYRKLRKVAEGQKTEYSALHEKFVEKVEENKRIQGKMSRLREDAQNKLDQASKDMADCLRERDESLLGLKLKVRQLEMELKSNERELEIKKNEAAELRDICNQLMRQVEPGSDVEQ
ncbi:hypothetical protein KIN20_033793 [Parelaphostrongylus tenuis]|uniref:Transforming acidic coiled-coil-containing protein C-terminal domain-containing protein n=1 Tax=Parelaphostrongylus tenuis TaxID=148309 RepID=A0AAD5R986_PARTN|nr:hypothetical protein KIN20_033793 [Parelaphostrongylus tenuis]